MKLKIAVAVALIFDIVIITSILLINLYQQQTSQPKSIKATETPVYTAQQVAAHNSPQDCWLTINQKVYDVSNFIAIHPGGSERIIPYCGQDATQAFASQGGEGQHSTSAQNQLRSFQIGSLQKKSKI